MRITYGTQLGLVRVRADRSGRTTTAQKIPATIELDLDRREPSALWLS